MTASMDGLMVESWRMQVETRAMALFNPVNSYRPSSAGSTILVNSLLSSSNGRAWYQTAKITTIIETEASHY
jgi:hypothetical protein